jgi:excisionase family DNA binding protein
MMPVLKGLVASADAAIQARLLCPRGAATYLGLGSRWAIYRLISTGQLPAIKLAGKLRIDRADLDALVETMKERNSENGSVPRRPVAAQVPARLAPLDRPRSRQCRVTAPVTAAEADT